MLGKQLPLEESWTQHDHSQVLAQIFEKNLLSTLRTCVFRGGMCPYTNKRDAISVVYTHQWLHLTSSPANCLLDFHSHTVQATGWGRRKKSMRLIVHNLHTHLSWHPSPSSGSSLQDNQKKYAVWAERNRGRALLYQDSK